MNLGQLFTILIFSSMKQEGMESVISSGQFQPLRSLSPVIKGWSMCCEQRMRSETKDLLGEMAGDQHKWAHRQQATVLHQGSVEASYLFTCKLF